MPDLDLDDSYDAQDEAETFDETHRTDEEGGGEDLQDEPDLEDDVYDVTSALGDADEDDAVAADDLDPEDLDDLDLDDEEDEDEDDDLDDDLEDEPEDDDLDSDDDAVDAAAARGAPIEPGLTYAGDLDAITNPRDDDVEKYESTRELSDEQLADLGYRDLPRDEEIYAVKTEDGQAPVVGWEERSFAISSEEAVLEGYSADEIELDQALEGTFPASDPVSAKHIT
jgi:hypothetical protein